MALAKATSRNTSESGLDWILKSGANDNAISIWWLDDQPFFPLCRRSHVIGCFGVAVVDQQARNLTGLHKLRIREIV